MRIVFMGSAALAVPSLQLLVQRAEHEVVGVITQPDRPAGRKRLLTPCPVKAVASSMNLTICTPEKISCDEMVEQIQDWQPDLMVVVAYGQYIPKRILSVAPHEAINVHPTHHSQPIDSKYELHPNHLMIYFLSIHLPSPLPTMPTHQTQP